MYSYLDGVIFGGGLSSPFAPHPDGTGIGAVNNHSYAYLNVNLTVVEENALFRNLGVPKANRKRHPKSLFWVKMGALAHDPIAYRKKLEQAH